MNLIYKLWCKDNNEWEKDPWLITPKGKVYDLKRHVLYRPNNHILVPGIEYDEKQYFSGDIVTSKEYPFQDNEKYNYCGVIDWLDDEFCFGLTYHLVNENKRGISHGYTEALVDLLDCGLYKIGTIYENPNLLPDLTKEDTND